VIPWLLLVMVGVAILLVVAIRRVLSAHAGGSD
jgi:hypothetical protein